MKDFVSVQLDKLKWRTDIGKRSNRQQSDLRADNSRGLPKSL